ncbi:hypothetical protein [Heyndrickxia coagulans]|uniref:hypothetical protein n=1 Tax=Heyndrickxia coagulans TaxID=1398 RepID=UPI000AEE1EAA|nr:hypothetical protein [Heyndrickxia coagulans]MCR2847477.1 hypothetical protein [Heyndrickxia coagulans]
MFIVLLNRAGFKCRAPGQSFQLHIRMVIGHTYKGASERGKRLKRRRATGIL